MRLARFAKKKKKGGGSIAAMKAKPIYHRKMNCKRKRRTNMSCWKKRLPLLCVVVLFFSFASLLYHQVDALDSSDGGNDKQQQQQSSSSKYKRYKKFEDEFLDFKDRQQMLREYWKQTFEEIKASNPVVFPPPTIKGGTGGDEQQKSEGERILLERWKQFSDSGTSIIRPLMEEDWMIETYRREFVEEDRDTALKLSTMNDDVSSTTSDDDGSIDDETSYKRQLLVSSTKTKIPAPLRFDGFLTWQQQLQQWKEDVALYMKDGIEKLDREFAETSEKKETWIKYLSQPKEASSRYDLGNFGISSQDLKELTTKDDDKMKVEVELVNEIETDDGQAAEDGSKLQLQQQLESSSTKHATTTTISKPSIKEFVPPITLTNLDPNLPAIPKPRPVTSSDEILPHTDIADKSKNIWIVTTGALPWMTGTAVNPLLRSAYLSTGRKEAGGSVTLMLPWVEREADQEKIYGSKKMFETPADQEKYIRTWLRDTANMEDASEELNIQWYTAWQEPLENSLYSMGDLIALIPEEDCDICVLEEPEHLNWYRAPGENWTAKYKHVVGIVHTNYFVYATEQPAAFIRVSVIYHTKKVCLSLHTMWQVSAKLT